MRLDPAKHQPWCIGVLAPPRPCDCAIGARR
jgi:hypothetical protein